MDYNFELTTQEIEDFTVVNPEYYIRKWQKHPGQGLFAGWNWAAFFLTWYWMAYRKMWGMLGIYILILFLVFIFELLILWSTWESGISFGLIIVMLMLTIFIMLLPGLLANGFYRRKTIKVLSKTTGMTENERKEYLHKHGNVSGKALSVAILISAGLYAFNLFNASYI